MPTRTQLNRMREVEFEYPQTRRTDDPMYVAPKRTKMKIDQQKFRVDLDVIAIIVMLIAFVWCCFDWNAHMPHYYSDAAWYYVPIAIVGALIGGYRRMFFKPKV